MSDYLRVKITGRSVPDGYRYTFREDGFMVRELDYRAWIMRIEKHYRDNGYPMPEDWIAQAEDQLCRLLPPGECAYESGREPEFFLKMRFGLDDAINGTKVLAGWTASGFPLVSKELAESRGATCAACYANVVLPGCGSCVQFANIVAQIVGTEPLKSDQQLEGRSCAYCHCASRANVWVPTEVSRGGVSQEALDNAPPFCWKKKEIALLTEKA